MKIDLPVSVSFIIKQLNKFGYEAYVVGGCVRDSLLCVKPKDWDICTSAEPAQIKTVFSSFPMFLVGEKYGTVSLILDDGKYEITTFRKDGDYKDYRHPEEVLFSKNLEADLSRRDFTINAMAYSEKTGLVDLFGGMDDLRNNIIRCVGDPEKRFREDALRMLRAIRFASTLGFSIEKNTRLAIHNNLDLLYTVSAERFQKELNGILLGQAVVDVLLEYNDVICALVPEMTSCVGFEQNNKYHSYTVYEHIVRAVGNYKGDDIFVKLALFLHDIGKPLCYSEDEKGGHFYGHAEPSAIIAEKVLLRLRYDRRTIENVKTLVLHHDAILAPSKKSIRKWFSRIGETQFRRLLKVRKADILAHAEGTQDSRLESLAKVMELVEEVANEGACISLKNLAVNGDDLMGLGMPEGKSIGIMLHFLLDKVICEEIDNDKDVLIAFAKKKMDRR